MPAPCVASPKCPRYIPAPPTEEKLDFADLAIIDLAKAQTPKGRAEIYPQVRDALRTNGFMYVVNHGYTQAQRDRFFDIADVPFSVVPPEEMKTYRATIEKVGEYQGFKPRRYWHVDTENKVLDQIEQYGINRNVYLRPHPQALRPFLPELDAFARHNHINILHPILRLLALSLELPEDTLVKKHTFDANGVTAMRYPRSEEEERLANNVWFKGHTDYGSVTILWSQPVSGLQILSKDGKWKWVQHMDNALVINTGDTMEFLSGGFYKPTIHRVVQPPKDQRSYSRLGVFYFSLPNDDVRLLPCTDSPVLQRIGIERKCADEDAPLAGNWMKERSVAYGRKELKKGKEEGVEEELINGIVVKHYN
ncbi:hypothetical protein SERLA73DRAFT_123949 [Serpula lacrymans var. lacrymans S7.3]|uniref:Fe2OG dioxygenase domain-containing protein n=2 Tax=Serpula lacrymans var. lacrymans TaxID=341189 RepID=F8Q1V5_SERL3|nr:uncharacterized protein SERLADRAFT_371069 [Serpula lacrymans var. lacrymans S7.9]EGN97166.1 hypothetical protein SERLA73DRAFT_123949 [Serpula lacrymans var. lacrymans S7.3]EGO22774.1 hypothetical protein SERLADRAFT_371069 [Serpula lacrymans var. lacrymans S7.9]